MEMEDHKNLKCISLFSTPSMLVSGLLSEHKGTLEVVR